MGIKPLVRTNIGDSLLFASEVKALQAHEDHRPEFDELALAARLVWEYPLDATTLLKGVHQVRPGTVERWALDGDGKATTGEKKVIRFAKAIIAAGSEAVKLPFIPEDPRIVDSTGALELREVPGRMLVIGGGIIGLEMATVYSTLGARIDVVEMLDGLMQGADRDLVKVWDKMNKSRFDKVMLKTKTVGVEWRQDWPL